MEDYIGDIILFAGHFCPRNYLPCDGAMLKVAQFTALASLLGNRYGGDGTNTFKLPDLRGKSPLDDEYVPLHHYICVSGIFPTGG